MIRGMLAALLFAVTTCSSSHHLVTAVDAPADFKVQCWKAARNPDGTPGDVLSTLYDTACPVAIEFVDLSGTFRPGDQIPMLWTVTLQRTRETTNELEMPTPPKALLLAGAEKPTQIAATYVRACASKEKCDPSVAAEIKTTPMTGNFTEAGDGLLFKSIDGLTFKEEGEFTISAQAQVVDAALPGTVFVFATYTTVSVRADAPPTSVRSKGTVKCRMTRQSALEEELDPAASVAQSDKCELDIDLDAIETPRVKKGVPVTWRAKFVPSDAAEIHLPSPLATENVVGKAYEVVRSALKVCKSEDKCDEYTADADLATVVSTGPVRFLGNEATFQADNLVLPAKGTYTAMLHLVLPGSSRRYDFTYYFEIVATDADLNAQVNDEAYIKDAEALYCWKVLADGNDDAVTTKSVAGVGKNDECPYTLELSMGNTTVDAATGTSVKWTLGKRTSGYSEATFGSVALSTVLNTASNTRVSLPSVALYACKSTTVCTPFATDKTVLFRAPAQNWTESKVEFTADAIKFPEDGTYTLMAHAVLPNGAVSRIEVASFASINVVPAGSLKTGDDSKSNTALYVGLGCGAAVLVLLIVVGVVWFRKRRHRRLMAKHAAMDVFGGIGGMSVARSGTTTVDHRGPGSVKSHDDGISEAPSTQFLYMRPMPSPNSLDATVRFDRVAAQNYDHYRRDSFDDKMPLDESHLSFAFPDERPMSVGSESYDV